MAKHLNKATTLVEALPYIQKFNNKVIVIKYGGSAMIDEKLKLSVIKDISLMKLVGIKPVVVHGGGNKISEMLLKIGKEPKFIQGLRVTDDETVEIAEMVLSGSVNKGIVQLFEQQGMKAVGISGKDGKSIIAKKKLVDGEDIGWVGQIDTINPELIRALIDDDFIPVIAPIACDEDNNTYNINADYVAGAIASELKAEKLIYMTDVEGVMKDVNDRESLISKIKLNEIQNYIESKVIVGGMIPKIECCAESIEKGVSGVHILDGRVEHSLILEVFTNSGIGTMLMP
ncbi:acetylglutamate kinase [Alkalibaculum sp. M08DMB]|uniref:Acetylglutamate kinase n=1 Tax=Alkalibaculum sporogenes TaxID=2655001 RepID=A0A6A7KBA8_9FIRM|nr:acetylglutamate kinase [Alkalibaculum sporogenes]MPW26635.1 acetylglutamate kinase [Alkalibaculum sporogenes]